MLLRLSAVVLAPVLLVTAPVSAAPQTKPPATTSGTAAPATSPSPTTTDIGTTGGKTMDRFGWGGVGLYSIASTTLFGFNAGAAVNVAPLTPDLPLAAFGNIGLAFGDATILPLTAGAMAHYDKLPVSLAGGLGFTIVPHTGGGTTPFGLGLLLMGMYPLPQVAPNVSAMAQLQYHFLTDGFSMFALDVGAGYSF